MTSRNKALRRSLLTRPKGGGCSMQSHGEAGGLVTVPDRRKPGLQSFLWLLMGGIGKAK